jgi:hypothetical protein
MRARFAHALLPGGPLSVIISVAGVAQAVVDVPQGDRPALAGGVRGLRRPIVHYN